MTNSFIFVILCVLLNGCIIKNELENAMHGQNLSQVNKYNQEEDKEQYSTTSNSLWRPGSRSFFKDQRARGVGDILKVIVDIQDQAKLQNNTNFGTNSAVKVGVPHLLGFETSIKGSLPKAFDPTNMASINSTDSMTGTGTIDRKETITTVMSATVTEILPTGNLHIVGSQEVLINNERRMLCVEGVIQARDISADNSVKLEQIAEARIYYGGKGDLSQAQRQNYGTRLLNAINPF